jgi:hypothetical protein
MDVQISMTHLTLGDKVPVCRVRFRCCEVAHDEFKAVELGECMVCCTFLRVLRSFGFGIVGDWVQLGTVRLFMKMIAA